MEDILFDFIGKYMQLSDEEKTTIISLDIFHSFPKAAILLREGESSKNSYFVLNGCIRTFYHVEGEEKTTAFYTEMEGLTPTCVVSKNPSEYNISCTEDSILVVADPRMEEIMFEKFPRFETLCRVLSEQLLVKTQISFDQFKTLSAEKRYLNLIETRPDLIQRIPQHQLASFIGITPQSLSRLRARLSAR